MHWTQRDKLLISALLASLLLAACGGGGSNDSPSSTAAAPQTSAPEGPVGNNSDPNAPALTGDSATDGFNWFNYRRQQLGMQVLQRNSLVDLAAQRHSQYQATNNIITHEQDPAKPGFTGEFLSDRLTQANYRFTKSSYAYGEVISKTVDRSGVNAAEALIAAIYHRFLVFEPMFSEGGSGAASGSDNYMYFTTNFTANGLDYSKGLPSGVVVTYPFSNQTNIPVNFFSDYEVPDPVPNRNEVGYPISVHANIDATITIQSFTVRPRGGSNLATVTVTSADSGGAGPAAVSIVPLDKLRSATVYDVQFSGIVKDRGGLSVLNEKQVTRSWSFTTR